MGVVYNKFQDDGLTFDIKRRVDVLALDYNKTFSKTRTYLNAEWAFVFVDVPETYSQQFGTQQSGGFFDIVQPIFKRNILGFEKSVINAVCRFEYVDWNVGTFRETGTNISDDVKAIVGGLSWRPTQQTVIRLNYRYNWQTDLLGNPASKTAGFQFGFSSYF
jgi:hypothetical protein